MKTIGVSFNCKYNQISAKKYILNGLNELTTPDSAVVVASSGVINVGCVPLRGLAHISLRLGECYCFVGER